MKGYEWDDNKNIKLQKERGVSFEQVVVELKANRYQVAGGLSSNFPEQLAYIISLNGYPHYIPFEAREEKIRLITIIPDRRLK